MKLLLVFVIVSAVAFECSHAAAVDTPVVAVVDEAKDAAATDVTTPTPDAIDHDCYQPKETGRCFALFYRFAYNVESRACEEFVYGGCAGNANNFETREDCENKCHNGKTDSNSTEAPVHDAAPAIETTTTENKN